VVTARVLPKTWTDRDELLFHAVFQILADFVELEQPLLGWDDRVSGRFTDTVKMREYIERSYGPEAEKEEYYKELSPMGKVQYDREHERQYAINTEMLYLYEWYMSKNYEFNDTYYELTGETATLEENGLRVAASGKEKHLTTSEVFELECQRELVKDVMLRRVIGIRGHLWT